MKTKQKSNTGNKQTTWFFDLSNTFSNVTKKIVSFIGDYCGNMVSGLLGQDQKKNVQNKKNNLGVKVNDRSILLNKNKNSNKRSQIGQGSIDFTSTRNNNNFNNAEIINLKKNKKNKELENKKIINNKAETIKNINIEESNKDKQSQTTSTFKTSNIIASKKKEEEEKTNKILTEQSKELTQVKKIIKNIDPNSEYDRRNIDPNTQCYDDFNITAEKSITTEKKDTAPSVLINKDNNKDNKEPENLTHAEKDDKSKENFIEKNSLTTQTSKSSKDTQGLPTGEKSKKTKNEVVNDELQQLLNESEGGRAFSKANTATYNNRPTLDRLFKEGDEQDLAGIENLYEPKSYESHGEKIVAKGPGSSSNENLDDNKGEPSFVGEFSNDDEERNRANQGNDVHDDDNNFHNNSKNNEEEKEEGNGEEEEEENRKEEEKKENNEEEKKENNETNDIINNQIDDRFKSDKLAEFLVDVVQMKAEVYNLENEVAQNDVRGQLQRKLLHVLLGALDVLSELNAENCSDDGRYIKMKHINTFLGCKRLLNILAYFKEQKNHIALKRSSKNREPLKVNKNYQKEVVDEILNMQPNILGLENNDKSRGRIDVNNCIVYGDIADNVLHDSKIDDKGILDGIYTYDGDKKLDFIKPEEVEGLIQNLNDESFCRLEGLERRILNHESDIQPAVDVGDAQRSNNESLLSYVLGLFMSNSPEDDSAGMHFAQDLLDHSAKTLNENFKETFIADLVNCLSEDGIGTNRLNFNDIAKDFNFNIHGKNIAKQISFKNRQDIGKPSPKENINGTLVNFLEKQAADISIFDGPRWKGLFNLIHDDSDKELDEQKKEERNKKIIQCFLDKIDNSGKRDEFLFNRINRASMYPFGNIPIFTWLYEKFSKPDSEKLAKHNAMLDFQRWIRFNKEQYYYHHKKENYGLSSDQFELAKEPDDNGDIKIKNKNGGFDTLDILNNIRIDPTTMISAVNNDEDYQKFVKECGGLVNEYYNLKQRKLDIEHNKDDFTQLVRFYQKYRDLVKKHLAEARKLDPKRSKEMKDIFYDYGKRNTLTLNDSFKQAASTLDKINRWKALMIWDTYIEKQVERIVWYIKNGGGQDEEQAALLNIKNIIKAYAFMNNAFEKTAANPEPLETLIANVHRLFHIKEISNWSSEQDKRRGRVFDTFMSIIEQLKTDKRIQDIDVNNALAEVVHRKYNSPYDEYGMIDAKKLRNDARWTKHYYQESLNAIDGVLSNQSELAPFAEHANDPETPYFERRKNFLHKGLYWLRSKLKIQNEEPSMNRSALFKSYKNIDDVIGN